MNATRHILHVRLDEHCDAQLYRGVLDLLADITPRVQALAPCAADLDVTGALQYFGLDPGGIAHLVQLRIAAHHGLGATVAAAANRLLATMAADAFPGVVSVLGADPAEIDRFLRPRPPIALPGVGAKSAALLSRHGLHTIGTIADTPLPTLQRLLGAGPGRDLHERARGADLRPVVTFAPGQVVSAEHRFTRDELDPAQHRRALLALIWTISARLRDQDRDARRLALSVRYADRTTTVRTRALPEPSAHAPLMVRAAYDLYSALGLQRARVRALTVRAEDLAPAGGYQLALDSGAEKRRRLETAADQARHRFGPHAIMPAAMA